MPVCTSPSRLRAYCIERRLVSTDRRRLTQFIAAGQCRPVVGVSNAERTLQYRPVKTCSTVQTSRSITVRELRTIESEALMRDFTVSTGTRAQAVISSRV